MAVGRPVASPPRAATLTSRGLPALDGTRGSGALYWPSCRWLWLRCPPTVFHAHSTCVSQLGMPPAPRGSPASSAAEEAAAETDFAQAPVSSLRRGRQPTGRLCEALAFPDVRY